MKINNLLVLIFVFLLVLSSVHAISFDASVVAIKDKIIVDELAEFDIVIENHLDTAEEFTIKKSGYPFWDMYTDPVQNPINVQVPGQGTGKVRLFVDPLYITTVDTYTLDVGISLERTGEEIKVPVEVGIKSTSPLIGGYQPTVLSTVDVPESIDPRNELKIRINLNNQNVLDYPNLTVKVDSDLFNEIVQTTLGPKEEKIVEVAKKLDPLTPPGEHKVVVAVFRNDRVIVNPSDRTFEVKEYRIEERLPTEKSFLKIREGVKITSNNPDYRGTYRVESSPLKNFFLTTSPKAESIEENGKNYLQWSFRINEDRTVTLYWTENYRPLVVLIIAAISAVILYFVFRSPLVVRKSVASVSMSEGGISEAKVVVRVKNRSAEQITGIEVMDNVPHIADVHRDIEIGSIQPHAILRHPKRGLMIRWNVEALEPGDEKVLSYKMKSRLSILGEFSLQAATARAKVGNKVIISNSNRVSVSA